MKSEKAYRNLLVWKKADQLAYQVYVETKKFPKEEAYGITSQLRKAALSVVLNLVEGSARHGKNEMRHFASISMGSLAETEYLLEFSLRLDYLSSQAYDALEAVRKEAGALLWNFHKSLSS